MFHVLRGLGNRKENKQHDSVNPNTIREMKIPKTVSVVKLYPNLLMRLYESYHKYKKNFSNIIFFSFT